MISYNTPQKLDSHIWWIVACKGSGERGGWVMSGTTKSRDVAFKARVALEAVRGEKTIAQLASESGLYPNQIGQWKKKVLEDLPMLFSDKRLRHDKSQEELEGELYRQIGQLRMEIDWLKKRSQTLQSRKSGR